GDCKICTSVTSSSALITAAALRPRNVQPKPPLPSVAAGSTLPASVPHVSRRKASGSPASVTACSKYQFTPYFRSPLSVTSAIWASMCTCIGITSRRSTTSRIDFQAREVVRTSKVLASTTADTPTRSPSTSRGTLPLPFWRGSSCSVPSPSPPPLPVPPMPLSMPPESMSPESSKPPSPLPPALPEPIENGSAPGASDTLPSPPVKPRELLPPPNTSDRRSARSLALMYFSSYENSCIPAPAPSMRSSHCWIWSRYSACGVITSTALAPSSGMKRNMPATGVLLCSPNTFSRSCTTLVALPYCSGNTPTDMLDIQDRKSTRLNSSHVKISYAVFCLKKKNKQYD